MEFVLFHRKSKECQWVIFGPGFVAGAGHTGNIGPIEDQEGDSE